MQGFGFRGLGGEGRPANGSAHSHKGVFQVAGEGGYVC